MKFTIRIQRKDGGWLSTQCEAKADGTGAEVHVPSLKGTWLIHREGMIANVGGNDWAIYTLHPEDCARIVAAVHIEVAK